MKFAITIFAALLCGCCQLKDNSAIIAEKTAEEIGAKFCKNAESKVSQNAKIVCADQSKRGIVMIDAASNRIVWQWTADADEAIASQHKKWFNNIDEVKPVNGTSQLLVTASCGAVAIIDIAKNKAVFYAYDTGNLHSAALLPDGNIVTAASDGNHICLFDKTQNRNTFDTVKKTNYELEFAHGVVWDKKREILWALGLNQIKAFKYETTPKTKLVLLENIYLPTKDFNGHDLYPIPDKDLLFVTGEKSVCVFDPVSKKIFTACYEENLKSISQLNGEIIFLRPEISWYSQTIKFANGKTVASAKGAKFYKARWLTPNTFSE